MFGIKTKIIRNLEKKFEASALKQKTPTIIEQILLSLLIKNKLKADAQVIDIQGPLAKHVNSIAFSTIRNTANYMPNNLGNWSIKKGHSFTSKIEHQLIEAIKQYYHCGQEIAGHFGSGSTEGNIYATWIGRNYLMQELSLKNLKKIILIKSCLAHYSIDKAANITGVNLVEASIDKRQFNLDPKELIKQIDNLYKQGFRGFLIPLTLGYTITGTDDDYENIAQIIEQYEKIHTDCKFFLWLDAAFAGISKIYTEKIFTPLKHKNIKLITADFHKFLAVPYPASFMLYRKNLLKLIEKEIPYIGQSDTTLLGSRPGINVLVTWMTLLNLGKQKILRSINQALQKKENFLLKIAADNLDIQIINNKNSLHACIVTTSTIAEKKLKFKYQLKPIEQRLIFRKKSMNTKIYKLYFFVEI